jgi:uncharacterized membrane protein YkoI
MRIHYVITAALSFVLVSGCASERGEKEDQASLLASAKITESAARDIALAKVPGGRIKEGELEKEHGHLQWSFDVATPGVSGVTEVNVDAISGEVISVENESAEKEKAEKKEEKN